MKIGIIGAGTISAQHIESYQKCGATVLAIADRNEENARLRAEAYGISRVYSDTAALLADGEIEAVSVATPVSSHAPLVLAALAAGKHVLCEKPPAMTGEEVLAMQSERDRVGKVLQFGFVRRYDPRIRRLKRMREDGEFGKLLFCEAGRLARVASPGGWFSDRRYTKGGALFDAAIHEIDSLLYILGYPRIASLRAYFGYENRDLAERLGKVGHGYRSASTGSFQNDVETSATIFMTTEDGMPIVLRATAATATVEEGGYLSLTGSHAGARFHGTKTLELVRLGEHGYITEEDVTGSARFDEQIRHFLACCESGERCDAPCEDALALMRIYDAIYLSASEGREVSLRED